MKLDTLSHFFLFERFFGYISLKWCWIKSKCLFFHKLRTRRLSVASDLLDIQMRILNSNSNILVHEFQYALTSIHLESFIQPSVRLLPSFDLWHEICLSGCEFSWNAFLNKQISTLLSSSSVPLHSLSYYPFTHQVYLLPLPSSHFCTCSISDFYSLT